MCRRSGSVYRERLLVVQLVMVSVLLGACASGGIGSPAGPRAADSVPDASDAPTVAVVNNRSWDPVTVYITEGTAVWRLGEVGPLSQRTMPLAALGTSLINRTAYFVGRRLAGAELQSDPFDVTPGGGNPTWTIENHAALSYVLLH